MSTTEQVVEVYQEEATARERLKQALVNISLTAAGCVLFEDVFHHPSLLATALFVTSAAATGLEVKYL